MVIKADGLAAGKGVVIAQSRAEADDAIDDMLTGGRFGDAGRRVVVEEFLAGDEASFICMVDGDDVLPLATSQDHKAAYDGDTGPNTGGMGAFSPAAIGDELHAQIMAKIIRPTVRGLAAEGMKYRGFLYAGLMIDDEGDARVLEFNCRLGDPETQPILMRMKSDLVAHCLAATQGNLADEQAEWDARCAVGVVMAAQGYPGEVVTGDVIDGLKFNNNDKTKKVFHAATKQKNKKTITTGGRVLCATAMGKTIKKAAQEAYEITNEINWNGCWYRTDIGSR